MRITNRLATLERARGKQRTMILTQSLTDDGLYTDDNGTAYTEAQIAVMGQDADLLLITIQYVDDWPP